MIFILAQDPVPNIEKDLEDVMEQMAHEALGPLPYIL